MQVTKAGMRRDSVLAALLLWNLLAITPVRAAQIRMMTNEPAGSGDRRETMQLEGRRRSYLVHIPEAYDGRRKLPLVIVLHGGGGNCKSAAKMTRFSEKADREGFIVVYPNGTGLLADRFLTWDAGDCCGYAKSNQVDDVAFVRALIDRLSSELSVDPTKVYVAGFSNGAMMAYQVGCQLADRVAAIAAVSGSMSGKERNPARPLPVIIFHGTGDDHVPYDGGLGKLAKWGYPVNKEPVSYAVRFWVAGDGAPDTPVKMHKGNVTVETYGGGKDSSEVVLYTIKGAGHAWPGGKRAWIGGDMPCSEVCATDTIWDFFSRHANDNCAQLHSDVCAQPPKSSS